MSQSPAPPRIITDPAEQPAPAIQECAICPNNTHRGAVRELRVELLDANGQSLEEVSLREHFFCSERCARAAGEALRQEINEGTDDEIVPDLKARWRGRVARVFCLYTSVTPSSG